MYALHARLSVFVLHVQLVLNVSLFNRYFECNDIMLQVRAKGTAWAMAVELGCGEMRFGECGAGGTCDMITTIRNKDRQLPITFSVARVAHFKIRPSAGRLLPLQVTNRY